MAHARGTSITTSLQLMEALALARRGRVQEAEATLTRGGALPEDPLRLQALAALTTSNGDYERGLALWRLVLVRDPQHVEAQKMVASIELWLSRPHWFRFLPIFAILIALSVVALGLTWALSDSSPPPPVRKSSPVSPSPSSPAPTPPAARRTEPPRVTLPDTRKR